MSVLGPVGGHRPYYHVTLGGSFSVNFCSRKCSRHHGGAMVVSGGKRYALLTAPFAVVKTVAGVYPAFVLKHLRNRLTKHEAEEIMAIQVLEVLAR